MIASGARREKGEGRSGLGGGESPLSSERELSGSVFSGTLSMVGGTNP
jgi:hypothetical protein